MAGVSEDQYVSSASSFPRMTVMMGVVLLHTHNYCEFFRWTHWAGCLGCRRLRFFCRLSSLKPFPLCRRSGVSKYRIPQDTMDGDLICVFSKSVHVL